MALINSYLTFGGNCRTAMKFYHRCFGGVLTFQTVGESPLSGKLPKKMKDCILHSTLINDSLILMGSDMVPDDGLRIGNAVSLTLNCTSEWEIKKLYKKLSRNGIQNHQIEMTFWGALFGDLTDQFGNRWLLHCSV
jgi:PhnB protein